MSNLDEKFEIESLKEEGFCDEKSGGMVTYCRHRTSEYCPRTCYFGIKLPRTEYEK